MYRFSWWFMLLLCLLFPKTAYSFLDKDAHLLNMQNGLSSNHVSSICKDRKGFVWLGTSNGLNRYDGTYIKNFNGKKGEYPISVIKEFDDDVLGILSNGNLLCFDRKKEAFVPVLFSELSRPAFHSVFALNDSVVTAISDSVLFLFAMEKSSDGIRFSTRKVYGRFFNDDSRFVDMDMLPDTRRICIADTRGRLIFMDLDHPEAFHTEDPGLKRPVYINSLLYDTHGVWIGTMVHGAAYFHLDTRKTTFINYTDNSERFSHTDVYKIIRLQEYVFLAATWNGYTLLYVDPHDPLKINTEVFNNFQNVNSQNIETRMITAYYDSNRILWIGTEGGGVIWSDLRTKFYNRYYQDRHNEICSVLADEDDRLWLATYHKGIMRSDEPFSSEKPLRFSTVGTPAVKQKQCVLSSVKDRDGNLWFGNMDGTLTFYEKSSGKYRTISLHTEDKRINQSPLWTLFIDRKNRFWIGTQQELLQFDRNTGICRPSRFTDMAGNRMNGLYIRSMAETNDDQLWIGTANKGLCKVLNDSIVVTGYESSVGLTYPSVRSLLSSSDGSLYVGYTSGFGVFSPQQDLLTEFYTVKNGLCSNFIGSLVEDGDGNIWLGSNSGISYYDRQQRLFYNYYISGSNRSSFCDGNMLFFGNNNSLTYFLPAEVINTLSESGRVFITGLEVNNKSVGIGEKINGQVILEEEISFTRKISLNHDNRNFSVSFNNLLFSANMQKFKYRLYPYQQNWLVANGGEKVSYVNLPDGKYSFEVRNLYQDKSQGKITSLEIGILPHWSSSIWFRFILFLSAFIVVSLLIRWVRKRQYRRVAEMQLKQELLITNLEWEKEKQIRIERENFFTNVAHELRTPLTLILAPVSELLHHTDGADPIYSKLKTIHKNGSSLHALVDRLLYVQKIEAGMVKLQLSHTDIMALLKEVGARFNEIAQMKKIDYQICVPDDPLSLWIDPAQIDSAVSNLLSNSFKYTPSGGVISLNAGQTSRDGLPYCRIEVKDSGPGIPEHLREHIFDSFITGEKQPDLSTAFGIGLRIVRNTMDLHHGSVTCTGNGLKGSVFTLLIPEGKEHFADDAYCESEGGVTDNSGNNSIYADEPDENVIESLTKGRKILVIEDNDGIRSYIRSLFEKKYVVHEAVNGEEGVLMANRILPDLIISDVMMPVKDGLECCRELKENLTTAHIPVLLLTARCEDIDVCEGTRVGADNYIMKPFNPEVLKATAENMIRQRDRLKRVYTKALMLKPETDHAEPQLDEFMQQVIHAIEMNLSDETFSVKKLAELLNMSQPTLYRKLKQCSNLAAIEIIRSVRISKAAALLLEDRYSIQRITEMVGYTDGRTLRKHFTEKFGVSPSQYIGEYHRQEKIL